MVTKKIVLLKTHLFTAVQDVVETTYCTEYLQYTISLSIHVFFTKQYYYLKINKDMAMKRDKTIKI